MRRCVYLLLPLGRATIVQIAESLGMNVRTLQRRLEEAGETFSGLLDAVRSDLALRYMENRKYPLQSVSRLLGFASPSSFSRWFAAEFGTSPREWRKAARQPGAPPPDTP